MSDSVSSFPIAIFDSSLGGLTVLKELACAFPHEDFLYLGDTARLPYGNKSPVNIRQYVEQNIRFLLGHRAKAIVVACNSASSILDPSVKTPVPLYNVITPGAFAATQLTRNRKVGVIGTRTTVSQQAYIKAIHLFDSSIEVYQQACPLLVPLVEEGWVDDPLTNLVIYRYLNPLRSTHIDTLIMGCTHYPVLAQAIEKVLGKSVQLVASGQPIAQQIEKDISSGIFKKKHRGSGRLDILSTDMTENFQVVAERILNPFSPASFSHINLGAVPDN